ncbi:MAG: NUDIX hydrolase [Candidatus Pacebacteria bacterium]|nr:NUDIX hydrolase [Candidatus Paceibacterota bacterium]
MPSERDFYQVSLKLFLKNNEGEVLCLKAARGGIYDGFYDLPGGRIHLDEFKDPLEKIIKREVQEEVGNIEFELNLKPVALGRNENPKKEGPLGGFVHILNIFFKANFKCGEIKISDEHRNFKWIKLEKDNLEKYFKFAILEGAKMYLENLDDADKN